MIQKSLFFLVLPLALAACGSTEPAPDKSDGQTAPVEVRVGNAKLFLNADGLSARGAEPLRFGSSREQVDALVMKSFGKLDGQSSSDECGAGPMEFSEYGPLQIAYLDGKFAGWFLRPGDGVVTSDGIKPGVTTMDVLKGERQVQELDTTLEGEFQYTTADYGTITGFADEAGNIDALQAGVSCFFR